ncbi:MAG: dephospho-CoA kinase [Alphaproteobacteria bacterium]|jgi:dephospho-CoA kinase|nr:dephospho-CoA kinase [Alphaproteobacteria bacterium]
MRILGLTGSIAMGKSATARMLGRLGLPIHDADACVHRLFATGGRAVAPISDIFPDVVENGAVNRVWLGPRVFGKPNALKQLEAIVHPLVRDERDRFLALHRRRRAKLVVLDVPLLYETGGQGICDEVMVVSAPAFLQRRRALSRPDMTPEKLASILARQMPDHEKRKRADVVIATGLGFADTYRRIVRYIGHR